MFERRTLRAALLGAALVVAGAPAARAQAAPVAAGADTRTCPVVPDTSRFIPTAQQTAEREEMRDSLVAVARRHGTADPQGLLFVTVDSTRRGRVLFLESNLTAEAVQAATAQVSTYLTTLEAGRAFQMLVRMEGEEPVMAAGKRHCAPSLKNDDEIDGIMALILERHPDAGKPGRAGRKSARLRLVVNPAGEVAFVDVDQPAGDAFIDQFVEELGRMLRFAPASLDGVPFDTRIRYTLTFVVK